MKIQSFFMFAVAISILMSCTKDPSTPQRYIGNGNDSTGNTGSGTTTENYVNITLVSKGAGNIKVNFKPTTEVSYYKCGLANKVGSMSYTEEKEINFNYLNPLTDYTFKAIAYDAADNLLGDQTATFRTDQAPYANYMRPTSNFFELSYATMRKESIANGYSQKILQFYGAQEGYWLQVYWTSYAYETIDRYWEDGTYTIEEAGQGHHIYYARYNAGNDYISDFYGGTMVIQHSGSVYNITLKDNSGMIVVKFAGTVS